MIIHEGGSGSPPWWQIGLMVLIYLRLHLKGLVHLSVVGKSVGKFSVAFHPAGKISSGISTNRTIEVKELNLVKSSAIY